MEATKLLTPAATKTGIDNVTTSYAALLQKIFTISFLFWGHKQLDKLIFMTTSDLVEILSNVFTKILVLLGL